MIPLRLTIEGLYSYQERQVIDFEKLTDAGLFGIFGAVGSGKSSILEAITYVLYGETERLNKNDRRSYNMMNLKSDRSYIELDFINHKNETYRATREFKRNSKNFDDIRTPVASLYRLTENSWIPLPTSNVENIIGLNYTNFKRTIIIPQGQFKEFLELGEKDRTLMMKEIFGLERFDLQEKTTTILKQDQSKLDHLNGQLKGYEEVSIEEISALQSKISEVTKELEKNNETLNHENIIWEQFKILKHDFETLEIKKKEFSFYEIQKPAIQKRRSTIELYEKYFNSFHYLIIEKKRLHADKIRLENELSNLKFEHNKIDQLLKENKERLSQYQPLYESLEKKRAELGDWDLVIQNIHIAHEETVLSTRLENGELFVNNTLTKVQDIEHAIKEFEKELIDLTDNKIDTQILLDIEKWYHKKQYIQKSIFDKQKDIEKLQYELNKLQIQLIEQGIDSQSFLEHYVEFNTNYLKQKKSLENKQGQLALQYELSRYANELKDGKACPLCGSLDHPNINHISHSENSIQEVSEKLKKLENNRNEWEQKSKLFSSLNDKIQFFNQQTILLKKELQNLIADEKQHELQFNWPSFSKTDDVEFQLSLKKSLENDNKIKELESLLKVKREMLKTENTNLERFRIELEKIKSSITYGRATQIKNEKLLQFLDWNQLRNLTYNKAKELKQQLADENIRIETNYRRCKESMHALELKKATIDSSLEHVRKRILDNNTLLDNSKITIDNTLLNNQIESLSIVEEVLSHHMDISKEKSEIEQFSVTYQSYVKNIEELELKLKNSNFNMEMFNTQRLKIEQLQETLKQNNEKRISLTSEITRYQKAYDEKLQLLKQHSSLSKRIDNLKTIANLFKGAGFVQYVASVYLRQLCDQANERFHRMTRHQLSLQLNEKGDFEIIDYLNEGRTRSVKTLSGGQSFQASLSLALALAETVQSSTSALKNFFFIDEGFGTQDAEAITIVFETLNQLQKENRIVGIISHVDELKERIPISLQIEKHPERGSLVSTHQ